MNIAVVLFNLGGPDSPAAVRPFLFNLFNDRAIIPLPQPLRWMIAQLISRRRTKTAQAIYALMGGRSPILPETEAQARALEAALNQPGGVTYRVHICMRYWHPRAEDLRDIVAADKPDRLILLPLYPQYSTTTTASSAREWDPAEWYAQTGVPTDLICCYPTHPNFIEAHAAGIDAALQAADPAVPLRLLFSAHGLPQKVVDAGDPYQWQVEQGAAAILQALAQRGHQPESRISYQSRVGPMQWLQPATDHEIERAGREGIGLVIVPIAFVSEHSETLVELDIEYRHLAEKAGVPAYHRVPALGTNPVFIEGLAAMVRARLATPQTMSHRNAPDLGAGVTARICPPGFAGCVCRMEND